MSWSKIVESNNSLKKIESNNSINSITSESINTMYDTDQDPVNAFELKHSDGINNILFSVRDELNSKSIKILDKCDSQIHKLFYDLITKNIIIEDINSEIEDSESDEYENDIN